MRNSQILKSFLATALFSSALCANAADDSVVVNVSGSITTATCTIAASDVNKTINIPVSLANDLQNASKLTPVYFSFGISNCDSSKTNAVATVAAATVASDVSGYGSNSVIANTGSATNVGIGLIGATSVGATPSGPLPVGTQSAAATLTQVGGLSTTSGTLYLGAQVVPLSKAVSSGAGSVTGTATVTFTYS